MVTKIYLLNNCLTNLITIDRILTSKLRILLYNIGNCDLNRTKLGRSVYYRV